MHPAATASNSRRLVGVSPLGQKQNLVVHSVEKTDEEANRLERETCKKRDEAKAQIVK